LLLLRPFVTVDHEDLTGDGFTVVHEAASADGAGEAVEVAVDGVPTVVVGLDDRAALLPRAPHGDLLLDVFAGLGEKAGEAGLNAR
tara:strand:+ start:268 stop:525 length:258 start_codon:yes stop_codon:yes gene_type:complete